MLIIVDIDYLFEAINVFDEYFPLLGSGFKFIFDLDSVMIMFSPEEDTISTEELLFMVFAGPYIAIEDLDASSVACALDIVSGCPIVNDRCFKLLVIHCFDSWSD
jgi:hypothetical protein